MVDPHHPNVGVGLGIPDVNKVLSHTSHLANWKIIDNEVLQAVLVQSESQQVENVMFQQAIQASAEEKMSYEYEKAQLEATELDDAEAELAKSVKQQSLCEALGHSFNSLISDNPSLFDSLLAKKGGK